MTFQEKQVSTCSVDVSHQWITLTLRGICVCTLLTVITYVVKFIIVFRMACYTRHLSYCGHSLQSAGMNVWLCNGNIFGHHKLNDNLQSCCDLKDPNYVMFRLIRISLRPAVGLAGGSWQQRDCNTGSIAREAKSVARIYMTVPMERWSIYNEIHHWKPV